MTYLQSHCLGNTPIEKGTVQAYYDEVSAMPRKSLESCVKLLCMSHERLRAEAAGAEIVWQQAQAVVDRLKERLEYERIAGMAQHVELLEQILGDYK
jgi:hypothetical protein